METDVRRRTKELHYIYLIITILLLAMLIIAMIIEELFPPVGAFWDWTRAELWAAPSSSALPRLGPFFVLRPRLIQFPVWGGQPRACCRCFCSWCRTGSSTCYAPFPSRARLPPLRLVPRKRSPENRESACRRRHFKSRRCSRGRVEVWPGFWRFGPASGGCAATLSEETRTGLIISRWKSCFHVGQ